MLYIVSSYHCKQFQGKLMNQTWKNDKKPNFEPNFEGFTSTRHGSKLSFNAI